VKHEIRDSKFRPFSLVIESKAEIDYLIVAVGGRSDHDEKKEGIDTAFAFSVYQSLLDARNAAIGEE